MSEPVFEASVRLRLDVGNFEQQAQASIKAALDRVEAQMAQAFRQAQQRAQVPAAGPLAPAQPGLPQPPPVVPPAAVEPVPVPMELVPPKVVPPIEVPPVEVATKVEPPVVPPVVAQPIEVPTDVQPPLVPSTVAPPVKVPLEVTPVAPAVEQQLAQAQQVAAQQSIEAQVSISTAQVEQQLAQARALADQPLDLQLLANTQPFERQTTIAYDRAVELARVAAQQSEAAAVAAGKEATQALEAVYTAGSKRTEAVTTAQAKQAARAAAQAAAEEAGALFRRIQGEAESARLGPATELQTRSQIAATRAETANLMGDTAAADALRLESVVTATQGAAETMKLNSANLLAAAGSAAGAERELLLAQAQNSIVAAEKLRAEATRLQREGLPPVQPPGGGGGPGGSGGFGGLFGSGGILGGRTGGLAGIGAMAARFGLLGLAAGTVLNGLGEVSKALRVTGEDAYSSEGKVRNFGAELLGGNLIGGIKALAAQRPAEISSGVQARIDDLKKRNDDLVVTEDKLIAKFNEGGTALDDYIKQLELTGAVSGDTGSKLLEVAKDLATMERAARTGAQAMGDVERAIAGAGSEAAAFGERVNQEGLRGPGGVQAEAAAAAASGGTFRQGTGGAEVANQIRESITSRIQDDQARLQLEVRNARIIQEQKRATFENVRGTDEAAAAWRDFVLATTNVTTAVQASRDAAREAALAGQTLGNRVRSARTAAIRDPNAQLQSELADARIEQGQALSILNQTRADARKGLATQHDINVAYTNWQEAVSKTQQIQNQIADNAATAAANANAQAKADRERRAAEQQAAAANQRQARELAMENDIAKAALTKRKSDDIKFYNIAIDYYRTVARQAGTALEREQAQAKVIQLRAGLAGVKGTAGGNDIELLRIENRIAAAQLTKGDADDKRFVQQLVAYWRQKVKEATGYEKEQARSRLIAAQLQLQGLNQASDAAEKLGTTAYDLLTSFAKKFAGGNLINADQPFVGPSGFIADMAQYLKAQARSTTAVGTIPGSDAGFGQMKGLYDRLADALNRNTAATEASTGAGGKGRTPRISPRRVTSRYNDGRYYEAARARNTVETRGGI